MNGWVTPDQVTRVVVSNPDVKGGETTCSAFRRNPLIGPQRKVQMTANPKKQTEETPAETGDPFDLSKLRLDQSFTEKVGVKKLLTTVPVKKPDPQAFIRVHPSEDYRDAFAVIELKADRESYLVLPSVAREIPGEYFMATIRTAITRQGNVFLWPSRMPGPDGKILEWHRSAAEAAALAENQWVRVKANTGNGAYDIYTADVTIAEPEWPSVSFQELLRIGFRDRLVDKLDHPVLLRLLRGA
jgi:hypothetical protein